jgi:hypothetical protein
MTCLLTRKGERMPKENEDSKPQVDRFVETARALGCDEDKETFEAALGKIAAHKPARPKTKKRLPEDRPPRRDR